MTSANERGESEEFAAARQRRATRFVLSGGDSGGLDQLTVTTPQANLIQFRATPENHNSTGPINRDRPSSE